VVKLLAVRQEAVGYLFRHVGDTLYLKRKLVRLAGNIVKKGTKHQSKVNFLNETNGSYFFVVITGLENIKVASFLVIWTPAF